MFKLNVTRKMNLKNMYEYIYIYIYIYIIIFYNYLIIGSSLININKLIVCKKKVYFIYMTICPIMHFLC